MIGMDKFLHYGSVLNYPSYIIGVVVYTGDNTKIKRNYGSN